MFLRRQGLVALILEVAGRLERTGLLQHSLKRGAEPAGHQGLRL